MICEQISAIILAGGKSSRMGSSKALLPWKDRTLIEHQIDKMRRLGIEDIIISGFSEPLEGTRYVPDLYPEKGPLGGIHAGLLAAKYPHCLVTCIDTPLVPADLLNSLIEWHLKRNATTGQAVSIVEHGGHLEPLMGVYDKALASRAEEILQTERTAVRRLFQVSEFAAFLYQGEETIFCDCNTPEEYESARNWKGM